MEYLAKSSPVQTIQEHTWICLKTLRELRSKYPNILNDRDWEILCFVVFYHDFGKLNVKFQNKIRKVLGLELLRDVNSFKQELGHNFLSCAYIDEDEMKDNFDEDETDIIYKSIYYHHARDYVDIVDVLKYVQNIISRECVGVFEFENWKIPRRLNEQYLEYVDFDAAHLFSESMQHRYFLIKGLLNKIDYVASSGIENIEDDFCYNDGSGLNSRIYKKINPNEMQQCMIAHKNENILVIASTGIGKTEGALLWIDDSKAFYTLPIKVASNAIYQRIQENYGYDKVAILHSDALKFYKNQIDGDIKYEQSKLLARPLTICTIDQLFKFVYKYNGGEMALATLAYSKLVIDEVQMYTPYLLATTVVALKMINNVGGKFCIITATMPKLLKELMIKEKLYFPELKVFHSPINKRHRIKLLENSELNYNDIKLFGESKRVLVIANTVKRAQEIYTRLRCMGSKVEALHSSYIKKDRAILEKRILKFAPNDRDREIVAGVWVTTQIVEASLDIDFDILFTEMCSIDSLLQRMGRVYRSRMYELAEPNVFILDNKNTGNGKIIDNEIYKYSLRAVKYFDGQLLEESDELDKKQKMMDMVYDPSINKEILDSEYYEQVEKKINTLKNLKMYDYEQAEVKLVFRDMDSIKVMPKTIYEQLLNTGQIAQWRRDISRAKNKERYEIKNAIDEYTVNLSHFQYLNIDQSKEVVSGSRVYLADLEYYFAEADGSNNLGLIKTSKKKETYNLYDNHIIG